MADVAVIGILMVSMGFVMWIGHVLAGMVGGADDRPEGGQMSADAIMWLVLLIAGLSLFGYLLAVLIHPEKW